MKKEDVVYIKAKLDSLAEHQDNWFKLLQERIPKWDVAASDCADLKQKAGRWETAASQAKFLMKGFWVAVGALLTLLANMGGKKGLFGELFALLMSGN